MSIYDTFIEDFDIVKGEKMISLMPTIYLELNVESVYQFI